MVDQCEKKIDQAQNKIAFFQFFLIILSIRVKPVKTGFAAEVTLVVILLYNRTLVGRTI